jgi:hypothetical protein
MKKNLSLFSFYLGTAATYFYLNSTNFFKAGIIDLFAWLGIVFVFASFLWLIVVLLSKAFKKINIIINSSFLSFLYAFSVGILPKPINDSVQRLCLQNNIETCSDGLPFSFVILTAGFLLLYANLDRILPLGVIKKYYAARFKNEEAIQWTKVEQKIVYLIALIPLLLLIVLPYKKYFNYFPNQVQEQVQECRDREGYYQDEKSVRYTNICHRDDNCGPIGCGEAYCFCSSSTEMEMAEKETFVILNSWYAKDKYNVYYQEEIIENADPQSFEIINDYRARDLKNYYEHGKIETLPILQ